MSSIKIEPIFTDPLRALEAAEEDYLRARGWSLCNEGVSLWSDPLENSKTHIARVAAYKQRQRDQAEENRKAGAR